MAYLWELEEEVFEQIEAKVLTGFRKASVVKPLNHCISVVNPTSGSGVLDEDIN